MGGEQKKIRMSTDESSPETSVPAAVVTFSEEALSKLRRDEERELSAIRVNEQKQLSMLRRQEQQEQDDRKFQHSLRLLEKEFEVHSLKGPDEDTRSGPPRLWRGYQRGGRGRGRGDRSAEGV